MLCLCGGLCICDAASVYHISKTKAKFRPFQTEKNEVKTPKIPAMRFDLFHLPSFWQFNGSRKRCFQNKGQTRSKVEKFHFPHFKKVSISA